MAQETEVKHEQMGIEEMFSGLFLDNKEKILRLLEEKNIYSVYDLLSTITSFKLTKYTEEGQKNNQYNHIKNISEQNGEINKNENEENNLVKKEINHRYLDKNVQVNLSSSNQEILNNVNNINHISSSNSNLQNLNGITNKDVENKNMQLITNKMNKEEELENNITNEFNMHKRSHVKEITNNEVTEKKRKKCNNDDDACFSIIIHLDLIKTLPINNSDKNKLMNYIQTFIGQNDMYAVCIYLNLRSLLEKLEQLKIKNIETLKKVLETNSIEWIKKNFEISNFEICFLNSFVERIKAKKILCSSYENTEHNGEDVISNIKKKNGKIICDKIHQFMEFDKWIFENIIDNPFFQRLRNLSQLGACQYVYPGATHTRFEHSLGVGFLSGKYFTHFTNELNVSLRDREVNRMLTCIQIAGLCHDLGHGPFSHTFEAYYVNYKKKKSELHWNHESMSLQIVERLVENFIENNDVLDMGDIKTIQKLIYGRPCPINNSVGLDPVDSLLEASFDIVCNNLNGLDADKFDYLQRDATIAPNNGTLPALNCDRLCDRSTIVDSCIVYNRKEIHTVWSVYLNRFSMFKKVYTHDKIRAMELMLCDGFRLSDHIFKWTEALENIDTFIDLTDSTIITDIKREAKRKKHDEKINHAANLINAVVGNRNSDYAYRYIDNFNITEPNLINHFKDITTEDRIARYAWGLNPDDIVIDWNDLNYGMGSKDPFDFVYFFNSDEKDKIFRANTEDRGTYPKYFQEYNVRLYCKNKKVEHLAKEAFRHFKTTEVYPTFEASHRNANAF